MSKLISRLALFLLFLPVPVSAWGGLGHHLIASLASKLVASHPQIVAERARLIKEGKKSELERLESFIQGFADYRQQEGEIGNVPDTYWRHLPAPLTEDGNLLGSASHFFDADVLLDLSEGKRFFATPPPLAYETAKALAQKKNPGGRFFFGGTVPWRANQFAGLYLYSLQRKSTTCDSLSDQGALVYAGLMTHFVGDASMPFHATRDADGVASGQKGIHWYFENDLVNAIELGLAEKVFRKAQENLNDAVPELRKVIHAHYGDVEKNQEVTALTLALLATSYERINVLRNLDLTYAVATFAEAKDLARCQNLPLVKLLSAQLASEKDSKRQKEILNTKVLSREPEKDPACRRSPDTRVEKNGKVTDDARAKTVAEWHEELIVERLALSTALLADVWVDLWRQAGSPVLCLAKSYAIRPGFISPTDRNCFGYALSQNKNDFTKSDGQSALPWKGSAKRTEACLTE